MNVTNSTVPSRTSTPPSDLSRMMKNDSCAITNTPLTKSTKSTKKKNKTDTYIDNNTCNVKSKTEYYDTDRILSKWGFTDNTCHNCHKRNSDLHGLLMQCAKCKKAYYCGMKCFNEHLPEHQKFCTTKEIYTEPKGKAKASPFEFEKEEPIIETYTESDTKINFGQEEEEPVMSEHERITNLVIGKTKTRRLSNNNDDDDEYEEYTEYEEEEVSEYDLDDDSIVEFVVEAQNENVMDLQSSMRSLSLPDATTPQRPSYHQSYNDFGTEHTNGTNLRPIPGMLPDGSDSWKMEDVDLRHTEQIKNHYSWSTPDWVMDSKLRPTSRGHVIKNGMGDIISPVTHAKILIDQGIISWKVPDWTNPKLRKTPRGEQIKRMTTSTTNTSSSTSS